MDYKSLWDYADALQREAYRLEEAGDGNQSAVFQRYADTINAAAGKFQHNIRPSRDDAQQYARDLLHLFSPHEIERHLPEHRRSDTYRATSALAAAMERASHGKPMRRFFGLFG